MGQCNRLICICTIPSHLESYSPRRLKYNPKKHTFCSGYKPVKVTVSASPLSKETLDSFRACNQYVRSAVGSVQAPVIGARLWQCIGAESAANMYSPSRSLGYRLVFCFVFVFVFPARTFVVVVVLWSKRRFWTDRALPPPPNLPGRGKGEGYDLTQRVYRVHTHCCWRFEESLLSAQSSFLDFNVLSTA